MTLRRGAVIAAGLAMATSFGLAGAGMASAAAPALKIKSGATWTLEVKNAGCEQDHFNTTTHRFTADLGGDKGTWSGGGSTISMTWTGGVSSGVTFSGHYVSTTRPVEYKGSATVEDTSGETAKVVKGAVASFDGVNC